MAIAKAVLGWNFGSPTFRSLKHRGLARDRRLGALETKAIRGTADSLPSWRASSPTPRAKAALRKTQDGNPVHSFRTLLQGLARLRRFDGLRAVESGFFCEKALKNQR
jgi:hypothetical protein